MVRWLAPRIATDGAAPTARWVLHDRDPVLLDRALADLPPGVDARTSRGDLTALRAADLAGTSLVTASALLDLLTADEVDALAAACAAAGCAALLALSVSGEVAVSPPDPLDAELAAAFDAHQRRTVDGRRLLGPDAGRVAAEAFARHGMTVETRPSPWRLGPGEAALAEEWLRGWGRRGGAAAARPGPGGGALPAAAARRRGRRGPARHGRARRPAGGAAMRGPR
jgi:hypothetical protein